MKSHILLPVLFAIGLQWTFVGSRQGHHRQAKLLTPSTASCDVANLETHQQKIVFVRRGLASTVYAMCVLYVPVDLT